jgi:hypothetical protein
MAEIALAMRGEAPNYCLQPTRPPGLTAGWDMSSGLAAEAMALDSSAFRAESDAIPNP